MPGSVGLSCPPRREWPRGAGDAGPGHTGCDRHRHRHAGNERRRVDRGAAGRSDAGAHSDHRAVQPQAHPRNRPDAGPGRGQLSGQTDRAHRTDRPDRRDYRTPAGAGRADPGRLEVRPSVAGCVFLRAAVRTGPCPLARIRAGHGQAEHRAMPGGPIGRRYAVVAARHGGATGRDAQGRCAGAVVRWRLSCVHAGNRQFRGGPPAAAPFADSGNGRPLRP